MKVDHPLRVVVDTNVWISAGLNPAGAPAVLVRRVLAHAVPVFSAPCFEELRTRLWKPKFDRYMSIEFRQAMLHDLKAVAHWVEVPAELRALTYSRDPADDAWMHAAVACEAAALVTGDDDLLVLRATAPVPILSPAEAITWLDGQLQRGRS
ncbi:MAG: putative toxin-antitoxin system toxin component, PIN family [Aquincola sp.]|nr:putative toxin-antitoxin system toxin component, PIN family [Aquincola sp.]